MALILPIRQPVRRLRVTIEPFRFWNRLGRSTPWWAGAWLIAILVPSLAMGAQLTLTWTDNANNESGFYVERRSGSGSYSQIAVLGPNVTSYSDPNLAEGTTYCYRVRAFNGAGVSGYANEACRATTQTTLNLTVNRSGSGSGTVSSAPAGINCGTDCAEAFPSGALVTLTAAPAAGSSFDGWSGAGCSGTASCMLMGNTNQTITAAFSASSPGGTCAAGQYQAEYYNNTGLTGTATLRRCETAINYDWGAGGPGSGVTTDNFSARWTGQFTFAAGSYVFTARADDGIRVWVDGTSIINAWKAQSATTYTGTVSLTAGIHQVKVEYYERGGNAAAQVGWAAASGPPPGGTCATGQFQAEYYNNTGLTGTATLRRCETAINYDWGTGGPGSGVTTDNFSARWTGQFTFAAGSYVFTARADDGIRVWVDGTSIINAWKDQSATTYTGTVSLTAGTHQVKVEYYERGANAVAQVGWAPR